MLHHRDSILYTILYNYTKVWCIAEQSYECQYLRTGTGFSKGQVIFLSCDRSHELQNLKTKKVIHAEIFIYLQS